MSSKTLFLLGATGYIGGSLLKGIINVHPHFLITALVRKEKDIQPIKALGVSNVILGSHEDLEKIQQLVARSDIVVNAADADDLPLTKAILEGFKSRSKTSSDNPILIHTSGTGVVSDDAEGEFAPTGQKIWNDNSEDDIRSIPPEQPHRLVDLEIFRADEHQHCSAYIVAPSTIYGIGSGPVNKISQQIPGAVRVAVKHKQAVYIGKGTNKWNNVHINDLIELYLLVLSRALSGTKESSSYAKFYFGSVYEHVWGDIIRQIGQILYEKGILPSAEAKSITLKTEPCLRSVDNNSRSTSDRAFALGWKPKSKSIEETLEEDVTATLA